MRRVGAGPVLLRGLRGVLLVGLLGMIGGGAMRWFSTRRTRTGTGGAASRWFVVTIYRRPEEVVPGGRLPEPLARFGDSIEFQVREAPGGRGTELAVRPLTPPAGGVDQVLARLGGQQTRLALRRALREAKCLAETGEVLRAEPPRPRPAPVDKATDEAFERAGRRP
ncbi:hypothetical protein GCM10009677_41320 [Sphaerisporangium rubeum]|uniref:Uncharacterized protein n=1 Tax=Sphaerisporangium rubeum TaxID=321317 RepID=A0A7X0IDR5_9ACTN|nr:hypothetical protein [Sphaerisporangium rubeum]MBB6473385.1 hypothetical protein [Sphaerisporangium rubeum]